jgi:hypothetical protein
MSINSISAKNSYQSNSVSDRDNHSFFTNIFAINIGFNGTKHMTNYVANTTGCPLSGEYNLNFNITSNGKNYYTKPQETPIGTDAGIWDGESCYVYDKDGNRFYLLPKGVQTYYAIGTIGNKTWVSYNATFNQTEKK